MQRAFGRLAKSVLRRLGQDAFLLSGAHTTPCRVNLEYGVQTAGPFNDAVLERTIASFDSGAVDPKIGDVLNHPDGSFKLDGKLQDAGYYVRFTVMPTTRP